MEMITKDNEKVIGLLKILNRIADKVGQMTSNYRPALNGERFLTNGEVSERLKISRRALQSYSNQEKIPYPYLGDKVLYKESNLERGERLL